MAYGSYDSTARVWWPADSRIHGFTDSRPPATLKEEPIAGFFDPVWIPVGDGFLKQKTVLEMRPFH